MRFTALRRLGLRKTAVAASAGDGIRIIVTGYFEHAAEALKLLGDTPVWGIGLGFLYGPRNFEALGYAASKHSIAGLVDGRNVWRCDLSASLELLKQIHRVIPKERIIVSTTCSLLHSPYSIKNVLESPVKKYPAFACEKVEGVSLLARLFSSERLSETEQAVIEKNREHLLGGSTAASAENDAAGDNPAKSGRQARGGTYSEQSALQRDWLNLPLLPATTIGSFPQTAGLRKAGNDHRKGGHVGRRI